jgi:hypothetical protein
LEARSRRSEPRRERDLLHWVRLLADEVGPRRPTSPAERRAAHLIRDELGGGGLDGALEPFEGYSTFAAPYGVGAAFALAPALLPGRRRLLRSALALAAGAAMISESSLTRTPVSRLLSRRPSQNLVATIEPSGEVRRTVCLVSHLDTSRGGLMFDPRFVGHLIPWLQLQAAACMLQATEPVLGGLRTGRAALAVSRLVMAAGVALLAERELRGEDAPGANDNASGTAVVAELALEALRDPPANTRIVVLMTGCEEAGLLGMQAFLRSRDTGGWLFVNFDNVGGDAPLRFLPREGIGRTWDADPHLQAIAADVAARRPELGLREAGGPVGLTYDATPVLARGGRALTLVAADEDGRIPDYHWLSDVTENVSSVALNSALEVGLEVLAAIDRGEADP